MAYIGTSPSQGVRHRYLFTATSGQTTFTGSDDDSRTLSYTDTKFMDVFLNGVLLDPNSDYTATTGSSVVLTSGASAGDLLEVIAFDTFSVFSGTFGGDVTVGGALTTTSLTPTADATSPIGSASQRYSDLYLSGGLYVGGTGAANYLDDYEEGTWTPVLRDSSPSGTIIGSTNITAYYVKVGRFVHLQFNITRLDTASLSGNLYITGLPYQSIGVSSTTGGAWVDTTGTDYRTFFYLPGSTQYVLFATTGSTSAYLTSNQLQNNRPIYASLTYQTT